MIHKLAGHESITTTERWVHLAPCVAHDAIESLRPSTMGDLVETVDRGLHDASDSSSLGL